MATHDEYVRIRRIGKGSFGDAFLCKRKHDRRLCVVKEINVSEMNDKARAEALNEVHVLSMLHHPNIVEYFESFLQDGRLFIVMDYADGGDLGKTITERQRAGGTFTEQQILDWFIQIVLALKHVHDSNILHRDLKTQNIFLTSGGVVKLGDFGIARVLRSETELAKTVIGTPYYLSPEICEDRPYDKKSDIWSLGCVLYELCMLKRAFDGQNLPSLILKILRGIYPPPPDTFSQPLRDLVAWLLQRDPSARPDLDEILDLPYVRDAAAKFVDTLSRRTKPSSMELTRGNSKDLLPVSPKALFAQASSPHATPVSPVSAPRRADVNMHRDWLEDAHQRMANLKLQKERLSVVTGASAHPPKENENEDEQTRDSLEPPLNKPQEVGEVSSLESVFRKAVQEKEAESPAGMNAAQAFPHNPAREARAAAERPSSPLRTLFPSLEKSKRSTPDVPEARPRRATGGVNTGRPSVDSSQRKKAPPARRGKPFNPKDEARARVLKRDEDVARRIQLEMSKEQDRMRRREEFAVEQKHKKEEREREKEVTREALKRHRQAIRNPRSRAIEMGVNDMFFAKKEREDVVVLERTPGTSPQASGPAGSTGPDDDSRMDGERTQKDDLGALQGIHTPGKEEEDPWEVNERTERDIHGVLGNVQDVLLSRRDSTPQRSSLDPDLDREERLSHRIEILRKMLDEELGESVFLAAYTYLRDIQIGDDDAASEEKLRELLGTERMHHVRRLNQLIVAEDRFYT